MVKLEIIKREDSKDIKMDICKQEKCTGCGLCSIVCPSKCIKMKESSEGFFYPVIEESCCTNCGKCRKLCPSNNNTDVKTNNSSSQCYAFQYSDVKILGESSSGGFFSAAANAILGRGGVVYAAVMQEDYILKHVRIENEKCLVEARKSKYLQSEIWSVYTSLLQDIKQGKQVLFVGTPCQVAAIKKRINSENLYTLDLICHGVSNSKIIRSYVKSMEKRYESKIQKLWFRYKKSLSKMGE